MSNRKSIKPEKTVSGILSVLLAVCMFIILLMTGLEAASFSETFYRREYKELDISDSIGTSEAELMSVTRELLSYLRGGRDDLDGIYVSINGTNREFFNDREKSHMDDVQKLFAGGYALRTALLIASAGLIAVISIISRRKALYRIFDGILRAGLGFLAIVAVILIYALVDFNSMFTLFHKLFFSNDLWLLNPETDLLIRLVPLQFFIDIAVRIALYFGAMFGALMLMAAVFRYQSAYAPWKSAPKRSILQGLRPLDGKRNGEAIIEAIADGAPDKDAQPDNTEANTEVKEDE